MGSFWTEYYPEIPIEPEFQSKYILPYLREFYDDPKAVGYPTSWDTTVDFSQTSFYVPQEKKYKDLEIVQSVRDHDIEVKGSKYSSCCGTSQAASIMSMKLGATKPDVCLTGYHIGDLAEETYRKDPAGGGNLGITDCPLRALYTIIELKWVPWAGKNKLDLRHLDLHIRDLDYANVEAIVQTVFYSLLGYDVSKCRSAIAWANGNYARILNLSDLPEGEEAVWEGLTVGRGGGPSILVEADPDLVTKMRHIGAKTLSAEEFGMLATGDHDVERLWKSPNSLIADYNGLSLNQDAKDRLDATIYLNLALATRHPEAVQDPPFSNHRPTNVMGLDTSRKDAYKWLSVRAQMRGCRRLTKASTKNAVPAANAAVSASQNAASAANTAVSDPQVQGVSEEEDEEGEDGDGKNEDGEDEEEKDKQGGDRRDEDDRNPDGKHGGQGGGAPGAGGGAPGAGNGSGNLDPNGGRPKQSRPRSDHGQEPSSKRQKRAAVSGPTEYLLPSSPKSKIATSPPSGQKRADVSGSTEYLPLSPKSMIATPPPSPSSFSTISSCFAIEHPVNVEEWCLSVKQEALTDRTFNDTAIHEEPETYTDAEKVFPREYWSHGDYIDHFSRLGVTFVLATPTEVDVLLARAAKFGWGGALGSG
ncbi:hypothetical protein L202_07590 [Cryptococcus amylolentus CBS 6039]|uniref:Uncharacterized protein n=1 Tax=Cryptococcus amylolentus CBS 6039 TaxID=1295533 RepID=A0A1E3HCR9_9TREE|nr:hypothetical protein L202_07590 [Cryptococcus amylolentus CBS 6039]ODN74137.1 hypothetical protein L202_07590 [Cryptococcus amylolentus CBS 6039]